MKAGSGFMAADAVILLSLDPMILFFNVTCHSGKQSSIHLFIHNIKTQQKYKAQMYTYLDEIQ